MLGIIIISTACADDDKFTAYVPTSEDAAFSFTFSEENPNKVIFTANTEVETWYTHWDFGDNSSSEGYEASKIFLRKGDYDVRFKIFTDGGVAESIQTIVINDDFQGPNILLNGEFNGSDNWTILRCPHFAAPSDQIDDGREPPSICAQPLHWQHFPF